MKGESESLSTKSVVIYLYTITSIIPLCWALVFPFFVLDEYEITKLFVTRSIMFLATGLPFFVISLVVYLLVCRFRSLSKFYLMGLMVVFLLSSFGQLIMFREFGGAIDERVFGVLQGNALGLFKYAWTEYGGVYWLLGFVLICCVGAGLLSRLRACGGEVSLRFICITSPLLIFPIPAAILVERSVQTSNLYDVRQVSRNPVFELSELVLNASGGRAESHLESVAPMHQSVREEIESRLEKSVADFVLQEVNKPEWLLCKPKNVFLFILESVDSRCFSGGMSSLVPTLNLVREGGVKVDRFYPVGGATVHAVHGILAGLPIMSGYPSAKTLEHYPLDTLPKVMERAGYESRFYAASDPKYGRKGEASLAYGYRAFIGSDVMSKSGVTVNEWGSSDGDFYQWAKAGISDVDAPQFITFLNVSNHAPYSAPVDELSLPDEGVVDLFAGRGKDARVKYAKHLYYSDIELGRMVNWLDNKYPGSLFVFVGDHQGSTMKGGTDGSVPFILYGPEVVDDSVDASGWFGTHVDMLATLANLVLDDDSCYTSIGRPLWDKDKNRVSTWLDGLVTPREGGDDYNAKLRASAQNALAFEFLLGKTFGVSLYNDRKKD